MNERALVFDCQGQPLVGVITEPAAPAPPAQSAVLVIVGGPQYRAGSHRQFVHLARHLAQAGVAVLRFDGRGMGDSPGAQRSFEDFGADIAAALATLHAELPAVRRVALWGLCDGASAALLYLQQTRDARVHGLVLLNPWARSEASLARTHIKHYYAQRLLQREFWARLFSGRVAGRALAELAQNLRRSLAPGAAASAAAGAGQASFQQRMAEAWAQFNGPLLLVLSGRDYTAREFLEHAQASPRWRANLALPGVTRLDVAEADHTFSQPAAEQAVQAATVQWLRGWGAADTATAAVA